MQLINHGGHCCGVKHLRGFGNPQEKSLEILLVAQRGVDLVFDGKRYVSKDNPERDHISLETRITEKTREQAFDDAVSEFQKRDPEKDNGRFKGGILEVILTDKFFENIYGKFWTDKLKTAGFVLVSRFLNTNSNNVCNVFHLYREPPVTGLPPNWSND